MMVVVLFLTEKLFTDIQKKHTSLKNSILKFNMFPNEGQFVFDFNTLQFVSCYRWERFNFKLYSW